MALDSTAPAITPSLSPAAPDTASGWYREPVSVTWQRLGSRISSRRPGGVRSRQPHDVCLADLQGDQRRRDDRGTAERQDRPDGADCAAHSRASGPGRTCPQHCRASRAIACTAGDPTSGVVGCSVSGYRSRFGAHVLTATATNGAGLTATSKLAYTVAKPAAISKLELTKLGLAKLRSSGLTLTVRVAAASTRLGRQARGPGPEGVGRGTRAVTDRHARRTGLRAARVTLRLALTATGKRSCSALARTTLKVTIAGSSARAKSATLKGSLLVRR